VKIKFNNIRSRTSKDLVIYAIGQGFNLITPLLVAPYLIQVCGIQNYGKVGVALAFSFFVIVIIDFGIDIIGVKDVSTFRNNLLKLQNLFLVSYTARLLLLLGVCCILSIIFITVPFFSSEKALFFLSFFILIGQYINPNWFLQGTENFVKISVLNIFSKIIFLGLVFSFIHKPNDYIYVNLFWGIGMIIPFTYGVFYCFKKHQLKFASVQKSEIIDYLANGYQFCVSQLFLSFKNYSPIILISLIGGFNFAGFYRVIDQIVNVFRTYLQITFRFFYPKICYLISNKNIAIAFWQKVNILNTVFVTFLCIIVFIFSESVLHFFKIQNNNIEIISNLLRFSLALPVLISVSYALEQLLFSLDKKSFYIKVVIPSVLFNFLMMFVLFNNYKLKGLISSLMVTEITVILAYSIFLYKYFKVNNLNK
jgi:O-antigen/teichoic acid export membrane protein